MTDRERLAAITTEAAEAMSKAVSFSERIAVAYAEHEARMRVCEGCPVTDDETDFARCLTAAPAALAVR